MVFSSVQFRRAQESRREDDAETSRNRKGRRYRRPQQNIRGEFEMQWEWGNGVGREVKWECAHRVREEFHQSAYQSTHKRGEKEIGQWSATSASVECKSVSAVDGEVRGEKGKEKYQKRLTRLSAQPFETTQRRGKAQLYALAFHRIAPEVA